MPRFSDIAPPAPRPPKRPPRPTHYKVIAISIYTGDLERLGEKVAELKRRGHTKMSKSKLIRIALDRLDLSTIEDPMRRDGREADRRAAGAFGASASRPEALTDQRGGTAGSNPVPSTEPSV